MTGTATDARVTTVTAEVRVLMVGSRQVTLSVARQLDHVDLSRIEPFGRVRLGEGERVIGRSREDGALALAAFKRHPERTPSIYAQDLDQGLDSKPVVCDRESTRDYTDTMLGLTFRGRTIALHVAALTRCGLHYGITNTGRCEHWNPNGHDERIQAAIDAWDAASALHGQAAKLPLIVLAGLR